MLEKIVGEKRFGNLQLLCRFNNILQLFCRERQLVAPFFECALLFVTRNMHARRPATSSRLTLQKYLLDGHGTNSTPDGHQMTVGWLCDCRLRAV